MIMQCLVLVLFCLQRRPFASARRVVSCKVPDQFTAQAIDLFKIIVPAKCIKMHEYNQLSASATWYSLRDEVTYAYFCLNLEAWVELGAFVVFLTCVKLLVEISSCLHGHGWVSGQQKHFGSKRWMWWCIDVVCFWVNNLRTNSWRQLLLHFTLASLLKPRDMKYRSIISEIPNYSLSFTSPLDSRAWSVVDVCDLNTIFPPHSASKRLWVFIFWCFRPGEFKDLADWLFATRNAMDWFLDMTCKGIVPRSLCRAAWRLGFGSFRHLKKGLRGTIFSSTMHDVARVIREKKGEAR